MFQEKGHAPVERLPAAVKKLSEKRLPTFPTEGEAWAGIVGGGLAKEWVP
jgi:hypothetical protein